MALFNIPTISKVLGLPSFDCLKVKLLMFVKRLLGLLISVHYDEDYIYIYIHFFFLVKGKFFGNGFYLIEDVDRGH